MATIPVQMKPLRRRILLLKTLPQLRACFLTKYSPQRRIQESNSTRKASVAVILLKRCSIASNVKEIKSILSIKACILWSPLTTATTLAKRRFKRKIKIFRRFSSCVAWAKTSILASMFRSRKSTFRTISSLRWSMLTKRRIRTSWWKSSTMCFHSHLQMKITANTLI